MRKNTLSLIIGVLTLLFLLYLGTRNKVDPEWLTLDQKLDQEYYVLAEAEDSLNSLFQKVHGRPAKENEITERLGQPFFPTMEFEKFKSNIDEVLSEKMLVFSSIRGSGTSTLTDRLARFIATKEANMLKVAGTVNFDLIYHRQYIGEEKNGRFEQGLLLDFFDQCLEHPDEQFVMVFNDIEKMEPETFFGPFLWYKLYRPETPITIGDKPIEIPPNFHMISVAHVKPTAKVILTDEHYQRIGDINRIEPDENELVLYLKDQFKADDKPLSQYPHLKSFVYAFKKANEIISDKFNRAYGIGQWSLIRKLHGEDQLDDFLDYVVYNVNSFEPRTEITRADLASIEYTINNGGKMRASNFISTQLKVLEEKGFLTEFLVGLSFLLVSAIFSFYIFNKREKIISEQILMVENLFKEFEEKTRDYDTISKEINKVKKKVDKMALNKKINYEEATFFYQYFYDKSRKVEIAKEAYQHFEDLIEVSLDDGILSDNEYQKLLDFLNRIKSRIGANDYDYFKGEIKRIHTTYKQN